MCLSDIASGRDAPANAADALAAVRAGLDYLAGLDATELTTAEQADCLRGLAAAESVQLAATAKVLAAFSAANGPDVDGFATAKGWLRYQARITRPAAGAAVAWMRRLTAHPTIAAALAAGRLSPSWARQLCEWSELLPEDARERADQILTDAALDGLDLADIGTLAEQIRAETARPDSDGPDPFGQRRLFLTPHFEGNARLDGDLTPQAAAALQAVLDSLGKRAGPEDFRTKAQRDHDAMEEACRLLIASGGLPDRAGQPLQIQVAMTLSQLLGQPEADPATAAWIAANSVPAPPGADCDASIVPIVTGTVDYELLDELAARLLPASAGTNDGSTNVGGADDGSADDGSADDGSADWLALRAARQLTIAEAVRLLSGPAGLAGRLRGSRLTGPAASISLPLDIGAATDTVPVHLRRAIVRRDLHCRFPGCDTRPAACHVHHVLPRSEGGPTSLDNCLLACSYHHLTAIHREGWALVLNPDGATTATSPDGRSVLHSHAPPAAA
jgi:hypothetical protein